MNEPFRRIALACAALAITPAARAQSAPGIPVTVMPATVADVPVYASGLGSVTPLASALIRAQVPGVLTSVAFTEGQDVKAGDLLAVIDPRPYQAMLDQAIAKRAQDLANLGNARLDLQRYANLARQGFAPRQQADTQSATVTGTEALIAADDAAVEAAQINVGFTRITSPIDGRAGLRQINPGNLVQPTDTQGVVMVTQMHPIGVLFTLPQDQIGAVAAAQNQSTKPDVLAIDSESGRQIARGTLLTAANAIDPATGTITLKAVFDNQDRALWPGAFVSARIRLRTLAHVVTVPARAVQRGQDGLYVFIAQPDGTAAVRVVTEYLEQDGTAAIQTGLDAGDQVVVDGLSRVSNGAKLTVSEARG